MAEKLVRDKIIEFSEKAQDGRKFRVAKDWEEIRFLLGQKLLEESHEVIDELMNPVPNGTAASDQLGDLMEVIEAIAKFLRCSIDTVRHRQELKRELKGSFDNMIVLDMETNVDPGGQQ